MTCRSTHCLAYPTLSCCDYVEGSLFSWAEVGGDSPPRVGVAEGTAQNIRKHSDLIGNVITGGIKNSILPTHDQNSHKTSK